MPAFACTPEHGIGKVCKTLSHAVGAALVDRERDRGVRWRLEQQELCCGGEKDLVQPADVLRQGFGDICVEDGLQRSAIA